MLGHKFTRRRETCNRQRRNPGCRGDSGIGYKYPQVRRDIEIAKIIEREVELYFPEGKNRIQEHRQMVEEYQSMQRPLIKPRL